MSFTPEQITEILQIYFDNFVSQTYTGMRYVPIIGRRGESSAAWDNSEPYEPLTIVTYNNESYTSRQYVPAGVAITNTDYWVKTGAYNAQIVALQDALPSSYFDSALTVKDYVDTLASFLPASDFDNDNTVKAYIDGVADLLPSSAFDSVNTVRGALNGRVRAFETVADMAAATDLAADMICHTNGFYASGDGGAAFYEIKSTGTANAMDIIACQDSLKAHLVIAEPFTTPEQFGAYGDGTHDDYTYIQRALNVASVLKPANTYKLSNYITLNANNHIDGGTFIADTGYFVCTSDNIIIENATFMGTVADNYVNNYCLKFDDCKNIKVQNCTFKEISVAYCIMFMNGCKYFDVIGNSIIDYAVNGIEIINGAEYANISNNVIKFPNFQISSNNYPIALGGSNITPGDDPLPISKHINCCNNYIECDTVKWEGIDCHGGYDIKIIGNTVIDSGNAIVITPITTSNAATERPNNVIITDNFIDGKNNETAGLYGINIASDSTANAKNITIANNTIKNVGYSTATGEYGGGMRLSYVTNCLIDNNIIDDCGNIGIAIDNVSNNEIKISNNSITNMIGPTKWGILFRANKTGKYNRIENNFMDNTLTIGIRGCDTIESNDTAYYVLIQNNTIKATYEFSRVKYMLMDCYANPANNLYCGLKGWIVRNVNASATEAAWICTAVPSAQDTAATWGLIKYQ